MTKSINSIYNIRHVNLSQKYVDDAFVALLLCVWLHSIVIERFICRFAELLYMTYVAY
jgi:hypothetical protein